MKNCVEDNLVCYTLIFEHDTGIGLPVSVLGLGVRQKK
jgi:hypothetical protein